MLTIFLILLGIYVIGVVVFTVMYSSWIGIFHFAAVYAALFWPFDLLDRWMGGEGGRFNA